MFPVLSPLFFKDGKYDPLQAKILEFNGLVGEDLRLEELEVTFLTEAIGKLKSGSLKTEFRACEKDVIHVKLAAWPAERMFPVIDLWRLFLLHSQSSDLFKGSDRGTAFIKQVADFLVAEPNSALGLCCARYIANLFQYQTVRYAAFDKRDLLLRAIGPALDSSNKHTRLASATVLLNFAVVLHEASMPPKPWEAAFAEAVARLALQALEKPNEGEVMKRLVFAIGTLAVRDKDNGRAISRLCQEAGLPTKLAGTDLPAMVGRQASNEVKQLLD